MDIWLAVMGGGGAEECVIGAYRTEELAEATAERASPGDWYTLSFALDEIPRWIEELHAEEERLRHPAYSDAGGLYAAEQQPS